MKDQVYSWRIDAHLKSTLEQAARDNHTTMSGLLEAIVTQWLQDQSVDENSLEFQNRLRESASEHFGSINGGDPSRSENSRQFIRDKLKRRHAG